MRNIFSKLFGKNKISNTITITGSAKTNQSYMKRIAMNTYIENGCRISAREITQLADNEVFVFGSNKQGQHGGGAAYFAFKQFGAEWGVGEGLTGKCYALPTMEGEESFRDAVVRFTECARQNPDKVFLVTAVGCGIAGYTIRQVAPWFVEAAQLENVYLPADFWKVLYYEFTPPF